MKLWIGGLCVLLLLQVVFGGSPHTEPIARDCSYPILAGMATLIAVRVAKISKNFIFDQ